MSLNAALSAAASGLAATTRSTQVVSDNIANVNTDGYGVRTLITGARGPDSGVSVVAIRRDVDPVLLGAQRSALATSEAQANAAGFWRRVEAAIGVPGAPGALTERIGTLEAALQDAITRPDSDARLSAVVIAAGRLVEGFGDVQDQIQSARAEADRSIARDVEALNTGLRQIDTLNREIQRVLIRGSDPNALVDQRQAIIDTLSAIVPLRELPRDFGRVALMTENGAIVLDQQVASFGFTSANVVDPSATIGNGSLSDLTRDGRTVDLAPYGPVAGGRLAASFALRDQLAVDAQAGLDAVAADLLARLAGPAADPTLAVGEGGIVVVAHGALPDTGAGLAGRLQLNPLVDPATGGELWRLRSGLAAGEPGPVGDSAVLASIAARLAEPASQMPGSAAHSLAGHAGAYLSRVGVASFDADLAQQQSAARHFGLSEQLASQGVDTDAELQRLLVLEQNYAANARVIRAVDEMLRRLMEI